MKNFLLLGFLHGAFWVGWRRWIIWAICIGSIIPLSEFRAATDAEFTLSSLALLPVLVIAWLGGNRNGLLMALLAAAVWIVGDIASGRQFNAPWIPWVNAATQLMTYSLVAILTAQVSLQFNREHEHATTER